MPAEFVRSLERGLAVIRAFDAGHPALTLSDVARRTGLTRAAARRFLHTLVDLGYVRTDGRRFSLRPKVLELGNSYLSSLSLPEVALPHMEELVAESGESVSLSILDGDDAVCVARVPNRVAVGARFPARATATGRVLTGAAQAVDEADGPRVLTVPVRGRDGRVVAALALSVHADSAHEDLLPRLLATAGRIEHDL